MLGSGAALEPDGDASDWDSLPSLPDPVGEATDRPELDLASVALAPTDDELHVMIRTAGPPADADRAYWIDVDAAGAARAELQVGLSPSGEHWVRVYDPAAPRRTRRARFRAAVGEVVEVALPWEALEAWSPGTGAFRGPGARPWIRVVASTWDRGSGALRDFASAAAYRPEGVPVASSESAVAGGSGRAPARTLPLPVEGTWLVSQGSLGFATHARDHAYDLVMTDGGFRAEDPPNSCRNADYLAWERPVRAPVAGRVLAVRDAVLDRPPCGRAHRGQANEVVLEVGDGLALRLVHLRRESAVVKPGQEVEAGALLARVGSSGASSAPHLHVELVGTDDGATRPLAFRNVRVGLNPHDRDPWARTLERWSPRAGYFVRPAPAGAP